MQDTLVYKENNNSKFKYLFYFITRAFLIAIVCLMVFFVAIIGFYFADLLFNVKTGNYKNPLFNAYVIVSPSMVPSIKINDAIIVKRVDNDDYNVGDIISFSSSSDEYNGLTVTHRIVSKLDSDYGESIYTTKGDNNSVVDPTSVSTDDIYGKVIFKIPKLGYIQNFLSKPINFFLCILVPSLIVLFYDLFRIFYALYSRKKFV
jgi:signal peptidase